MAVIAILSPAGPLRAQEPVDTVAAAPGVCSGPDVNPARFLESCLVGLSSDTTSLRRQWAEAQEKFRSTTTLNATLGEAELVGGRVGALLADTRLHFVTIETGDRQSTALEYDWRWRPIGVPIRRDRDDLGLALEASAAGLLTAVASENPDDFLESTLDVQLVWGRGGRADSAVIARHVTGLLDSLAAADARSNGSLAFARGMAELWDSLSTQTYLTFGPHLSYETDQTFDRNQYAVGVKLGVDVKAWNPTSGLAKANVFDWPAALLRVLTGTDSGFHPSGSSIPTLEAQLQRVTPGSSPERDAAGGSGAFNRVQLTLRSRSRAAELGDGNLVWLDLTWRHFREMGPSDAIRAAGLDRSTRFLVVLEGPTGFTVSWATGRLPLDTTDGDRWGLGWRFHF